MSSHKSTENLSNRNITGEGIKLKLAELIEQIEEQSSYTPGVNVPGISNSKNNVVPQQVISVLPDKIVSANDFNNAMTSLCNIFLYFRRVTYDYKHYRSGQGLIEHSTGDTGIISNNYYSSILNSWVNSNKSSMSISVNNVNSLTANKVSGTTQLTNANVTSIIDDVFDKWKALPTISITAVRQSCHASCHGSCHFAGSY